MTALESGRAGRRWARVPPETRRLLAPTLFVLANAIAFCLVRPGGPDLWAARARAAAVGQGVGVTYWFGWFGGSSPGGYSVLTPFICALLGTEVVAGIAAVAISSAATLLLRGTRRPAAGAWAAAVAVIINLWCGRVPFLVGAAFAVAAIALVRRRRPLPAVALTVLSVLASPVSGAFLGLALSGVLLTPRTRTYRGIIVLTIATAFGTLVALALLFGTPGPEPFPAYLLIEIGTALGLMLLTAPPDHLRRTLLVSALAAVVIFTFPNGLGANFARLALFCLPAAAVALSGRRLKTVLALMAPILVFGGLTSVTAVQSAARPSSEASYYAPLAAELDRLPGIANHRLELVDTGRAAYAALLDHAVLARGWETQEDLALNAELTRSGLDARQYLGWLGDNAVGYVAVDVSGPPSAEARLVASAGPAYLRLIWRHARWRLYEVRRPTPIVARPAALEASTQAAMRVRMPCACKALVRVRWSRFLIASPRLPRDTPDAIADTYRATLTRDRSGWTTLTTNRPGTYVLDGLL
jgi:hypothetical protein